MTTPKNSNLKRLKGFTAKAVTVYMTSSSLLLNPLILSQAHAEGDFTGLLTAATGVTQTIVGSIIQQRQQMMQMQQQMQMMQQLAPQNVPARFFPNCPVPASGTPTPSGVCEAVDPSAIPMAQMFTKVADQYESQYAQMLSPVQHSGFPVGLQCVDNERKKMEALMLRLQDSITAEITKIKKESQAFRDRNAEKLLMMDSTYAELHGSRGEQNTNNSLTREYANFFSPQCQTIITQESLNKGQDIGLVGIQKGLQPLHEKSAQYRLNQVSMKNDFDRAMSKMSNDLRSMGIDDFFAQLKDNQNINTLDYAKVGDQQLVGIQEEVLKHVQSLSSTRSRIQSELNKLLGNAAAVEIPSFGVNFSQDFGRFINNADDFFRKKYVHACVTSEDSGLSLSADQILRGLEHRGTNSQGNVHEHYRQALDNILKSDSFIEDKLLQIRQLDNRFRGEVTISYRDSNASTVVETPYQLYQKIVANCEQSYHQDNTYQDGRAIGSASRQEEVTRAKRLMNELKSKVDAFPSLLQNSLSERILNCSGRSLSANSCSQTDVFETSNTNFCFPHAATCMESVAACATEAQVAIDTRKKKISDEAAFFNIEAEALVTAQEATLNRIKEAVLRDAAMLAYFFPGSNYQLPEDLFVAMPAMMLRNGEMLRGGGEISFDDLVSKLESLRDEFRNQAQKIDGEVMNYMRDIESTIAENRNKWRDIKNKCTQVQQQIAQMIQQQNEQGAQQQAEADNAVGEFCEKFEGLVGAPNPVAGCTGPFSAQSLATDMGRIANRLDNNTRYAVQQYNNICNQAQNEQTTGTETKPEDNALDIVALCKENPESSDRAENAIIRNIASREVIPSQFRHYHGVIQSYLRGEETELPEDLADSDYGDFLTSWKSRMNSSNLDLPTNVSSDSERMNRVEAIATADNLGVCRYMAVQAAREARDATWDTEYERTLSSYNKNLGTQVRSIASVNNDQTDNLTREWNRIGENARNRCRAQAEGGRNPFSGLGEALGGLTMPSPTDFQNLNLGGGGQAF